MLICTFGNITVCENFSFQCCYTLCFFPPTVIIFLIKKDLTDMTKGAISSEKHIT